MRNNINHILENYRILLNIIESYSKDNIRCISITSNSDIEGKSIIARNVSVVLAKAGRKTLFIDFNLSDRSKAKTAYSDKENGIVCILEKMNSSDINYEQLKSYIDDTEYEYLSTLKLGINNIEKYNSVFYIENLKKVIELLKKSFLYIILEVPSFENFSYTQSITSASDGCLFVLKSRINEVCESNLIKAKINTLGCKVLGCIMSKEKGPTKLFNEKDSAFFNIKYEGKEDLYGKELKDICSRTPRSGRISYSKKFTEKRVSQYNIQNPQ